MAVKISDLPIITTATDDDYLPMVDPSSGQTRRILKSDLLKELRLGTDLALGAVKADKADFSVADSTARLAIASPFEGLTCYQKDVDATYIYDGTAWRRQAQWEEIGRHTLSSGATSLSCASLPLRKNLIIILNIIQGSTTDMVIRFNNDAATNYAWEYSSQNAAAINTVSATSIPLDYSSSTFYESFVINVENFSTMQKLLRGQGVFTTGTGAANPVGMFDIAGKYATNTQVSRVDAINGNGTNLAAGSELIILGKD